MSDIAVAAGTLYRSSITSDEWRVRVTNTATGSAVETPNAAAKVLGDRCAGSPDGQIAIAARSAANVAYGYLKDQGWVSLGPSAQMQCVWWIDGRFVFAKVGPGGAAIIEQAIVGGQPVLVRSTPIPGGTSQGLLYYDEAWQRFVVADQVPQTIGGVALFRPCRRMVDGRWVYCGQRVAQPKDVLYVTDQNASVGFVAELQREVPQLLAIGSVLYTNAGQPFPKPYPTTQPPEAPIVVPPVNRAVWAGFYAFTTTTGLPGNCVLRPTSDTWRWTLQDHQGHLIAVYVSGNPDGSLTSLEGNIHAVAETEPGVPIIGYWPRSLHGGRLPRGADWVGVEGYCGATETLPAFEARLRSVIGRCPKVALVAQCYTSNASLTDNLRPLVPIYSRLTHDLRQVVALPIFSGSGRPTGLQDHPEVRPLWEDLCSTVQTPALPVPPEPPIPPEPPLPPTPARLSLRASNGQYVCVEPDGSLMANRDTAGPWETFTVEVHGDKVALKSAHGLYVCAEGGGGGVLIANRPSAAAWELFRLRQAPGGVSLETDNHHYWCAEDGGGGEVNATRTAPGSWETFNGALPSKPNPPDQHPGTARLGVVRGNGFQFTDDTGGFLATGTSLFWAAYGYVFERDRIEAHLSNVASQGFHYVRVIATGLRKGTAERSLDPSTASFAQGIAGLTDLAYDTYGLRVQWSIFGAVYDAPSKANRVKVVDDFCAALVGRAHKVHAIEIANEGWSNGFEGDAGRDELSALVSRVRDRLPNLVAPTCPAPGDDVTKAKVQYYYEGTRASVITEHHARKTAPPDGVWRPTKKPWRETMFLVEGCPKLRRNQEPRGPESSGTETNDPTVLVTDSVVTWLSGEGDYLLHCGGGIYGLPDPARGRPADLWDTQNWDAICAGLRAMREVLPEDLPNFKKHKTNAGPFRFVDTPEEQLSAAYSATSGEGIGQRIVQPVYGVVKATKFTLQSGTCDGKVYDPATGNVLASFDRSFTVTPQQRAVIVIATRTA